MSVTQPPVIADALAAQKIAEIDAAISRATGPVRVVPGVRTTLTLADAGGGVAFTGSLPGYLDIPAGLPANFQAYALSIGGAPIRVNALAGVVITPPGGTTYNGTLQRNALISIVRTLPDQFALAGALDNVTAAYSPAVDYPPGVSSYTFSVSESAAVGTVVGQISATGAGPIGAVISAGDPTGKFALNATATPGLFNLVIAQALDFETKPAHDLTIRVSNLVGTTSCSVGVTVIDVAPAQPDADQQFSIVEGSPVGTVVGVIAATRGSPSFAILSGDTNSWFEIAPDGVTLRTRGAVSYPLGVGYDLAVTATDPEGTSPPVTVRVNVIPAASTYAPITDGAFAAFDATDPTKRIVTSGAFDQLTDLGPQAAHYLPNVDLTAVPKPLLQQIGSKDVLRAFDKAALVGNAALANAARATGYFGVELVVGVESTSVGSPLSLFSVGANSNGRVLVDTVFTGGHCMLRLLARRLDSDAGVTLMHTTFLSPNVLYYVLAEVNFLTGEMALRVDGVRVTSTAAWAGGFGTTPDTASKWPMIGYNNTTNSRTKLARAAYYRAKLTDDLIAQHRAAIQSQFGTA